MTKTASVSSIGDLICPNCKANIITPDGCIIVPGISTCPICGNMFRVSMAVAERAEEIYQRYVKTR